MSQGLVSKDLGGTFRNAVGVSTREGYSDMDLNQWKAFISWLVTILGVQNPSAVLGCTQGELLPTTMSWIDILQLARTVS